MQGSLAAFTQAFVTQLGRGMIGSVAIKEGNAKLFGCVYTALITFRPNAASRPN